MICFRRPRSAFLGWDVRTYQRGIQAGLVTEIQPNNDSLIAYLVPALRLLRNIGPAAARNAGTRRALGDVLFFVDADVVVASGAVRRVGEVFGSQPDVAADFGVVALNREMYAFFFRQRVLLFAYACIPLHLLYYLYSGLCSFYVWICVWLWGAATGRDRPVQGGESLVGQGRKTVGPQ